MTTVTIPPTSLHHGHRVLMKGNEAMAEAAKKSVEELLTPFRSAPDAEGLLKVMSAEEFFRRFTVHADKFTGRYCQDCAKIRLRSRRSTSSLEYQSKGSVSAPSAVVVTGRIVLSLL